MVSRIGVLVDECVNLRRIPAIFFETFVVSLAAKVCAGAPDEQVLAYAKASGLVLLTEDVGFGRLIFASLAPPPKGIVLLEAALMTSADAKTRLIKMLPAACYNAEGQFIVVGRDRTRSRKLPRV